MRKNQKILALISLALVSGCNSFMPKVKEPQFSLGKPYTPPDLELTLIQKDMPKRYIDYFSRVELHFSTNKSHKTHAILERHLTSDLNEKLKEIPLGTTMKESEWDKLLINKKKMENGFVMPIGNWQRFY